VSVYPTAAADARCAARGCRCATRTRAYPSDMTDAEWEILQPEAQEVMAQIRLATGRPMDHPLRPMLDAVRYLVRNGIEWRAMPVDFPPWTAVHAFHDRWSRRDLPQRLCHRLRERLRRHSGRNVQPSAAIVDSQSVKSAEWADSLDVGYDGGKKITGIKRHLAVDVEGFLLAVVVSAACIDDRLAQPATRLGPAAADLRGGAGGDCGHGCAQGQDAAGVGLGGPRRCGGHPGHGHPVDRGGAAGAS
jgi:transposase